MALFEWLTTTKSPLRRNLVAHLDNLKPTPHHAARL